MKDIAITGQDVHILLKLQFRYMTLNIDKVFMIPTLTKAIAACQQYQLSIIIMY